MHTGRDTSASERTPLLSATCNVDSSADRDSSPTTQKQPPIPWTYHAVTLAFVLLSLLLCLVVTVVFTAHSYVAPLLSTDPSILAQRSVAFQGPSRFDILNFTSEGLWCEVQGKVAIDVTRALGLQSGRLTDKLVSWAARKVGSVTVSTSDIRVQSDDNVMLATLDLPSIVLPLSTTPSPSLRNVTIQILVRPASNIKAITEFAAHSWEDGFIRLKFYTSRGIVFGGGRVNSWRSHLRIEKYNIQSTFKVDVPPIPGSPPSAPDEPRPIPDLAKLVYLESYRVIPPPPTLGVASTATFPNPLPSLLHGAIALSLPFVVSLPPVDSEASIRVARVETAPIAFTAPNISLAISGHVLPLPSSSNSIAPVSRFASDFLAGRSSSVLITTDFLRDLGMAEELTMGSEFPAAARQPEILRDVQISNMRIALRGEQILASAFVRAHIILPDALAAVRVNATRVWPDLLVYDGSPPPFWPFEDPKAGPHSGALYDEAYSEPDPMPLPRPLPSNAFARIRPDSWIIAHTEPLEQVDGKNQGVWVHAQVSDVPLDVLPGRDAELRGFIRKVIFNVGGAQAGIAGITAVAARVGGLVVGSRESGELEMFGLPLRGETRVGKKDLHEPGWGLPLPKNPLPLPTSPDIPTIPTVATVPTSLPSPSPTLLPAPEVPSKPTTELEQLDDDDDDDTIDDNHWPIHPGGGDGSIPDASYGEQYSEELWQVGVAY